MAAGPVVLALSQDVQVEELDVPEAMFARRLHRVPRPRPDARQLADAVEVLRSATLARTASPSRCSSSSTLVFG